MKLGELEFSMLNQDLNSENSKSNPKNKSFDQLLTDSINNVNKLQKDADQLSEKLALGKVDNVHDVMIAAEKAKLSLDLTLEVRNKIVDAYEEIMRMQV
ncbi:flagellar hook-basal body complex protein FliE [Fuchsiella alkaliacetigena]|uniref:flagellar hook-basal body complex protein FliE n=1 Tax=Fuchsiella alkaliacetigena TaxID=957042 RepID=UPI00200A15A8|nr:flagellar hook-basal body complex protein FliE [Fuchsiella alkaliacetigena]MCK8823556.1 flagellar hook-basal body complex protein FliE [Fuchsiella alkaliacetigena]